LYALEVVRRGGLGDNERQTRCVHVTIPRTVYYVLNRTGGLEMPATITITDERPASREKNSFTLDFLESHVTAREFIRRRIYEEVLDYNTKELEVYNGLVEPGDSERTLNGVKPKTRRKIDWEAQFEKALESFQQNGFIMLWNDRQVETLDEKLELREGSVATFLKLVPLVGG
jgi:hypothetical protein